MATCPIAMRHLPAGSGAAAVGGKRKPTTSRSLRVYEFTSPRDDRPKCFQITSLPCSDCEERFFDLAAAVAGVRMPEDPEYTCRLYQVMQVPRHHLHAWCVLRVACFEEVVRPRQPSVPRSLAQAQGHRVQTRNAGMVCQGNHPPRPPVGLSIKQAATWTSDLGLLVVIAHSSVD